MSLNGSNEAAVNQTTVLVGVSDLPGIRPEFIRLPKPGSRCGWTGLSRSKLNELILASKLNGFKPPVRSFALRNRDQQRATRLIELSSLLSYLRRLLDEQTKGSAGS